MTIYFYYSCTILVGLSLEHDDDDDDDVMTMMLAKNGRSCFIKEARKQQIMGLGGRKDTPRCRPIAAGKIQSSLFGFSAL